MRTLTLASGARRCAGLPLLLAILTAAAIAGCGSSGNGVASKPPAEILVAARAAAEDASSVHIESRLAQGRLVSTIDADLDSSHGAHGQISLNKLAYEAILIANTVYFKGSRALDSQLLGAAAAHLPKGTWLEGSATSGALAGLASIVSQNKLLSRLLASDGHLTKGADTTVNGQKVVELKETGRKLFTASLYVAATGKPYPIEILKRGPEEGKVTFSRWDEPVSVAAPANAVDVGGLERGGR